MKRIVEAMRQNNVTNDIIDFIRKNALVQEIDSKPVITSKGEQFLSELRSNPGLSGVLR
jgi:hypothetical protein